MRLDGQDGEGFFWMGGARGTNQAARCLEAYPVARAYRCGAGFPSRAEAGKVKEGVFGEGQNSPASWFIPCCLNLSP